MNPIAIALSYSTLSSSTTSQNNRTTAKDNWTNLKIIQIQIWEFEYFHYRINSIILFNMIPSTKVNHMIISICQNHFDTLSLPNIISSYSCWLSTYYSNSNLVLSKLYYIQFIVSFESCGVKTLYAIAHISRNFQIHYNLWTLDQVNLFFPNIILWPCTAHQLQYH
jgi:hypothetical protein